MVTIDINSVQQILQEKITFRHTKRLSKNISKSFVNHRYSIHILKNVFFSRLHIREVLTHKTLVAISIILILVNFI